LRGHRVTTKDMIAQYSQEYLSVLTLPKYKSSLITIERFAFVFAGRVVFTLVHPSGAFDFGHD